MTYYTDTGFDVAIQRPSIIARIQTAFELHKQRKALYSLTETQLDDIGLTREDAIKEYEKSLWVHSA
ncbi:MAG: DUF1127 domain-containing protein [Amylibacter sp.]